MNSKILLRRMELNTHYVMNSKILLRRMELNTHLRLLITHRPSSNRLAEHDVQTDIRRKHQGQISHLFFTYHITPHSCTRLFPAELLMGST